MQFSKQTGNTKGQPPSKISIGIGLLLGFAMLHGQPQSISSTDLSNYGGPLPTQTQPILIADMQQGDDPHGPDPHDEIHDKAMPSNQAAKDRKPPEDVYGGHELDDPKPQPKKEDDPFAADPRRN